jgi:hypothetical protein
MTTMVVIATVNTYFSPTKDQSVHPCARGMNLPLILVKVLHALLLCPSSTAFSTAVATSARRSTRKSLTRHQHHHHPLYRPPSLEPDDIEHSNSSRRKFLSVASFGAASAVHVILLGAIHTPTAIASTTDTDRLEDRFEQSLLKQPSLTGVTTPSSTLYGVDNLYYPDFMAGAWEVTQTLVNVETPIGLVYLGGPNGSLEIAEKSMAETKRQLNVPVSLELRYSKTKWGVAEDRVWNTPERLNKFAGRTVVAATSYANVGASNRAAVLALGGTENDPLQTVYVRFKGPAAQKSFMTFHRTTNENTKDSSTMTWYGSEGQRSIFALTNESTAPPIFTDSELLWKLERVDADNDSHVRGRLRIVGYLNALSDKLYFDARNRAVSIQDYTLDMKRIQ